MFIMLKRIVWFETLELLIFLLFIVVIIIISIVEFFVKTTKKVVVKAKDVVKSIRPHKALIELARSSACCIDSSVSVKSVYDLVARIVEPLVN